MGPWTGRRGTAAAAAWIFCGGATTRETGEASPGVRRFRGIFRVPAGGGAADSSETISARRTGRASVETGRCPGDSYGTGELEGRAERLLGAFAATAPSEPWIHSKLATYPWRLRPDDFVRACEASRDRLGRPVTLVGQHWSAETYGLGAVQDPAVYRGLAKCCDAGLAKGVGLSNLGPAGLRKGVDAVNAAGARVATHQTQFSLLCRGPLESGAFDVADEVGVASVGYSPLCLGLLSGRGPARATPRLGFRRIVAPLTRSSPRPAGVCQTSKARRRRDPGVRRTSASY